MFGDVIVLDFIASFLGSIVSGKMAFLTVTISFRHSLASSAKPKATLSQSGSLQFSMLIPIQWSSDCLAPNDHLSYGTSLNLPDQSAISRATSAVMTCVWQSGPSAAADLARVRRSSNSLTRSALIISSSIFSLSSKVSPSSSIRLSCLSANSNAEIRLGEVLGDAF